MTTQEECVEAKRETNSMHEESDVSNRHMTWWRNAWWIVWTADRTCGRREAVDESGEQPEGRPNRPATTTGSKRPRAQPKRQRERNGEGRNGSKGEPEEKKATPCTLSSTSQPQQLQPLQQVQQQQQQRQRQLQCGHSSSSVCRESWHYDPCCSFFVWHDWHADDGIDHRYLSTLIRDNGGDLDETSQLDE